MKPEVESLFDAVRLICLSYPDAFEKQSHGAPAFFIQKGGQFATVWDNHHDDGNIALLVAAPPGIQEALISSDPKVFYRPPYVGPSGWIGIRLDQGLDMSEVEGHIFEGYTFIRAKKTRRTKSVT